jgi:hypothetical protein
VKGKQVMDLMNYGKLFWSTVAVIGGLATIIGAVFGILNLIDNRIEKKISSEEYINKVAASVRPSIIYDLENRSVLNDLGGMKHIEKIQVQELDKEEMKTKIIILPKRFMESAPLISVLDFIGYGISIKRGEGISWEYVLDTIMTNEDVCLNRIRIEIMSIKQN